MDNVASEGSDSFDKLIKICKSFGTERADTRVTALIEGGRYLKGNFRVHCSLTECQGIADHCIKLALSDVKESCYQSDCRENHTKICEDCASLAKALIDVQKLVNEVEDLTNDERDDLNYDATQNVQNVLL